MKRKQWLCVLAVVVISLIAALSTMLPFKSDKELSVAVAPQTGFSVVSQNPLSVSPGETASFRIEMEDGYSFAGASAGSFQDGLLTVPDVRFGQTIYLSLGKQCVITIDSDAHGSAQLLSGGTVARGETASIRISPEPNYVPGPVEVNGTVYPAPTGDSFTFAVSDDSRVLVHFLGEARDFLLVSGNLGRAMIKNAADVYRYGDVIHLEAKPDSDTVSFLGWSLGAYLSEGGELVSSEKVYEYTLTEDTILYANFADRSSYRLSYDGNGGQINGDVAEDHAPGEYLNIALSDGSFQREGYTLLGFSTEREGGEVMTPGAMLVMPRNDLTLYAQWAEHTDLAYLEYTLRNGSADILGLSEAGKNAGLNSLVLPSVIEGKTVTGIGSSAFSGCSGIESVVLPSGLTTLNHNSFADCPDLTTVYFPESLTYLSDTAFKGSENFTNMRVIASLSKVFDYEYNSALADKYIRLKNTEGKRLILVAGSNLSFGTNSAKIQERFPDYTVINFGVSAYYGMLPLFDLLRANVHEGDIVIFCPEYTYATYAATESATYANWQYLESNYDILKDVNIKNNPSILGQFTGYLSVKKSYLPNKKLATNPAYSRAGFNQFGDVSVMRNASAQYGFSAPDIGIITDHGMESFNEAFRDLTNLGAKCCFSFSAHPAGNSSLEHREAALSKFVAKLESKLDSNYVTIISNMAEYFFPGHIFYDSPYHMTLEGAEIRTDQLIADLEAYMEVIQ